MMPALTVEPDVLIIEAPASPKPGGPGGGGPRGLEPDGHGGGGDDDRPRRGGDGGPSAGMIGIIATMVSITALFATLVIAYAIRAKTRSHWQPVALPYFLWVSTVFLVLSSGTLEWARRAFDRLDGASYGRRLLGTFFLGLAFVVSQVAALRELTSQGIFVRENPHSSLYYVITAAHGVHVLGGIAALCWLIWRVAWSPDLRPGFARHRNFLAVTTTYWHFLDGLWIALLGVLIASK